MENSIKYANLMAKADLIENFNEDKAKHLRRQAYIVKVEAGATKVDKRKFNFNIKIVFNFFFTFVKSIFSLFASLIKLIFPKKKSNHRSHKKHR